MTGVTARSRGSSEEDGIKRHSVSELHMAGKNINKKTKLVNYSQELRPVGERRSVLFLCNALGEGANKLIGSTRSGGMFSLLLSPSSTVTDIFIRFGLGVESGVGRDFASWREVEEVVDDGEGEVASDEA